MRNVDAMRRLRARHGGSSLCMSLDGLAVSNETDRCSAEVQGVDQVPRVLQSSLPGGVGTLERKELGVNLHGVPFLNGGSRD